MSMAVKIIVRDCKSKDGKKAFKSFKLVDEDNNGKLIDCVLCKSIEASKLAELSDCHKATIVGDWSINNNYEFPKAFIRSIDSVEKLV